MKDDVIQSVLVNSNLPHIKKDKYSLLIHHPYRTKLVAPTIKPEWATVTSPDFESLHSEHTVDTNLQTCVLMLQETLSWHP